MSNIKNYWFSRELETGLFLNFLDRHSKIEHKHLLCSGSDVNNYQTECQFQCIDIKECSKTLYDLALLSIVKNGLDFKINKYELPKLLIVDIDEVKYFMEENNKFCSDLMKC
uniref:Uncharacterized protein n=1 Tax=Strongyloides papillosus TaxID=174720 RepID=A0A0N5CHT6_STREA